MEDWRKATLPRYGYGTGTR
ncbi:hypothetical protein A2U01_0098037, partial [Trifolium medium]|nr:hypothetical protein [Trifolium medium]